MHCRQGTFESDWENEVFVDKYGGNHVVKKFRDYEDLEAYLLSSDKQNVYFDIDLDFFTIDNPLNSGRWKEFSYLSDEQIKRMLTPDRPLISWILQRLWGFTIAIEPEHTGGLLKANKLLELISTIFFEPGLFSNYGEHRDKATKWKHLR